MTPQNQDFIVSLIVAVAGPFFLFVSGLVAFIFQWMMSVENRRRELEDRRDLAAKVQVATEAAQLAVRNGEAASQKIHAALGLVGQKADAAYNEANQSNLKIQAVQDVLTQVVGLPQKEITADGLTDTGKLRLKQTGPLPPLIDGS